MNYLLIVPFEKLFFIDFGQEWFGNVNIILTLDPLVVRISKIRGAVAQLGERMTGSHEVVGSIPISSTKEINNLGPCESKAFFF